MSATQRRRRRSAALDPFGVSKKIVKSTMTKSTPKVKPTTVKSTVTAETKPGQKTTKKTVLTRRESQRASLKRLGVKLTDKSPMDMSSKELKAYGWQMAGAAGEMAISLVPLAGAGLALKFRKPLMAGAKALHKSRTIGKGGKIKIVKKGKAKTSTDTGKKTVIEKLKDLAKGGGAKAISGVKKGAQKTVSYSKVIKKKFKKDKKGTKFLP